MIYLDNAATTLHKPPEVGQAMLRALNTVGNPSRGTHDSALQASSVVYSARKKLARYFNCPRPDHVIFTQNATHALNLAICGAIPRGSHVLSTVLEHNSVLRPLYRMEDAGEITLDLVRADAKGNLRAADFAARITPQTRAIVCTHASNLTGNVTPIEEIGALCRSHGLLFIVDASQTAGCLPIDCQAMGIDILCFTGHKGLMGPQGTGGLCIRPGVTVDPLLVGGSGVQSYRRTQPEEYPTHLEAGTLNSHGIAGLSAALDVLERLGSEVYAQEHRLMRRFYEGVRDTEGVTVYGDCDAPLHTGVVTLNIRDYDSNEVADELAISFDIATRSGAHCAPMMHQALGTTERGAVRFSFGYYNTPEEVDRAIDAVRQLAR